MGMFATRAEAEQRLRICFECEEITVRAPHRCKLCHCYMRAKVQLRTAACPKGKWLAGRFLADPITNDPAVWTEENAIIEIEMREVPVAEAEYALSMRWPEEARKQ